MLCTSVKRKVVTSSENHCGSHSHKTLERFYGKKWPFFATEVTEQIPAVSLLK